MKKIRDKFSDLLEWYSGLTSIKKMIVTIIGVIILFILVRLVSMIDLNEKIIDYKNLSLNYVVENCDVTYDKECYVKSNAILCNLLLTSTGRYEIQEKKVKLNDYAKYAKYKEYNISSSKFGKLVNGIADDVFMGVDKYKISMDELYPIIKNIYTYSKENDMYIVEINTPMPHAIGIKYTTENTFYIFYLE